jgi:hypothetical protein
MSEYGWPIKDVTQRIYDNLEPLSKPDESLGWPLLAFVNTMGEMFQPAADLCEDGPNGEPGWSVVLDINRVADEGLDYLAQFLGLHFYIGIDAPTKRQQIRDHVSWQRGTVDSILAAVRLYLTGTKTVQLSERDTSAYHFNVTIWQAEAPADTTALVAYVNKFAKPGGLWWTLTVNTGTPPPLTYKDIYDPGWTYKFIYDTFETYGDIRYVPYAP